MNFIAFAFAAALSYAVAAPFSDSISMTLSETNWSSAWTYAAWALSYLLTGVVTIISFAIASYAIMRRAMR